VIGLLDRPMCYNVDANKNKIRNEKKTISRSMEEKKKFGNDER